MFKKNRQLLGGLFLALIMPLMSYGYHSSIYSNSQYFASVKADKADARYKVGETGVFEIVLSAGGKPAAGSSWSYEMVQDGLNSLAKGELKLVDGRMTMTFKCDKPSFFRLIVSPPAGETNWPTMLGGAACEPEKITPSMPKPDDFDAFWNGKKALLDAMTNQPVLTPAPEFTDDKIETFALILENINGSHVYGWFAKPKGAGPFPAFLHLNPAVVGSISPQVAVRYAKMGAMALDINPHDLPNGKPAQFYKDAERGPVHYYFWIGREDRETSYFLRMFCGDYQAAQYLAKRSDWDRKHLLVNGYSMGGGQAFATAYLCTQVTAFAASVPALCDHTAREAGRIPGWYKMVNYEDGKPNPKHLKTARYFDGVNFAYTIRAKALVAAGFIDGTCPPGSVYAAYNALQCDKQMADLTIFGHIDSFGDALNGFLKTNLFGMAASTNSGR